MKEYERFLKSSYQIGIFLGMHIAQLKHINQMAKVNGKKMIYHVDMIHGIKGDDYATEYICQEFKPYGLISTKSSVILKAKQKGVLAVQRTFLLDTHALEKSYKLIAKTKPNYIEVLPGAMPWMIKEVFEKVNIPNEGTCRRVLLQVGIGRKSERLIERPEKRSTGLEHSRIASWNSFDY
jgi:glycerol uptake operon antiterminator